MLGKETPLWAMFFDHLLVQGGKEIIDNSFKQLNLESKLEVLLKSIKEKNPDHDLTSFVWSIQEEKIENIKKKASGLTPSADSFLQSFENQITTIMDDLQYLWKTDDQTSQLKKGLSIERFEFL